MSVQDLYKQKRCSRVDAMDLVKDGDFIIIPTATGEPPELLTALSEQRRRFHGVRVAQLLAMRNHAYFDPETIDNVRPMALFLGAHARSGGQQGWIELLPNYFSEIPTLIERDLLECDVVFTLASPMNSHGYFSISMAADYTMAAMQKARTVILEVNPNVPFVHGNCHIHISKISALIESDAPILEVGLPKIGPVQEAIGKYVAEFIPDGSTLQIGYGGIPDAVVMQLTNKKHLGIHTEMIGDGILRLVESGAVTNDRKNMHRGKMIATFALGSKKLYEFMHQNPMLEIHPVNDTNDPYIAGKNDNLIAINASLEVDFMGQCCSESMGALPYSGTGGQTDFVRAANRSNGGKAFIVLPSTAKNDTISRIQPTLSPGAHVTVGKNDVNYVVTEYGVAQLRGKSSKQRTQQLIAIAHPKFRDELTAQAKKMHIL
jgi:acyl-CoA hydrolase